MERKRAGRMAAVPQLDIPDILVDDEAISDDSTKSATSQRMDDHRSTQRWSWAISPGDRASPEQSYQHPLSAPRLSPTSPTRQGSRTGYNFEFQPPPSDEPENRGPAGSESARFARAAGSSMIEDMLDDSVWVESIRRSATLRRSERGSYRYGDNP